jgi:hypothetical protein
MLCKIFAPSGEITAGSRALFYLAAEIAIELHGNSINMPANPTSSICRRTLP